MARDSSVAASGLQSEATNRYSEKLKIEAAGELNVSENFHRLKLAVRELTKC